MSNTININGNGLFTNYIHKSIPMAFDESMGYYETLCGLLDFLQNTVIPTVNANGEKVNNLETLFNELKTYVENYFNNLDVQVEINNKLDDLVKNGVLQQYVDEYFANVDKEISDFKSEVNSQLTEYKSEVNSQLNDFDEYTQEINRKVNVNSSRIDSFTNLQQGSTTGDAELIDGRISYYGKNNINIGDNIRNSDVEAIKQVNNFLPHNYRINLKNYTTETLYDGSYLDGKTGNILKAPNRYGISDYISVLPNSTIYLFADTGNGKTITQSGAFYDKNKILYKGMGVYESTENYIEIKIPENIYYIRVTLFESTIDNSNIIIQEKNKRYGYEIKPEDIIPDTNLTNRIYIETKGKYISQNGSEIENNLYGISNFIEIEPNSIIKLNIKAFNDPNGNNVSQIGCWYDDNKNFIKGTGTQTGTKPFYITAPSNAKFLKLSISLAGWNISNVEYEKFYHYPEWLKIKESKLGYGGRTWAVFGDSLTDSNNTRATKRYFDYVADDLGVNIINYGIGGTGYKTDGSNECFYKRMLKIDNLNFDVMTIFGSFNDLGKGHLLGEITDNTTDTICGCINETIDNFYKVKPLGKLIICTPSIWKDGAYYGNVPVSRNDLDNYVDKLIGIAKYRRLPVLDIYHDSGLNPNIPEVLTEFYNENGVQDIGVHPNTKGNNFMYPLWREEIKKYLETH